MHSTAPLRIRVLLVALLCCFFTKLHAGSATVVVTGGGGSSLGVQVFTGTNCSISSQNAFTSPGAAGTYTVTWSITAISYKIIGGSWAGCSGYTGPCVNSDPNGSTFTFASGNCTPTGTNNPCSTTYPQQSCWTNNLLFSVLAIPVIANTGGNPGLCNCLIPGRYPGYSLGPGEYACFDPGTPECPWSVSWDIWWGGNTNGPPNLGPTNGPGTNGYGIFPPKDGWNPPGDHTGPTNMPPGSGQGSNSNLTGGQFSIGLGGLGNIIWQGDQAIVGAINGLSNSFGGSTTTNAGIGYGVGTNGPGFGFGTNAGSGQSDLGFADLDASNLLSVIGNAPSNAPAGAGALALPFFGTTLNLDPENVFPGVPALCRQFIGWAATLWFLIWFAAEYKATVGQMASAELGGVPDLETLIAGTGGNLAGTVTALTVPIVFIGLWVVVLTFGLGKALSAITGSYLSNPFSSLVSFGTTGQGALYLMQDLMPLNYLLALIWTRLLLSIGMTKLTAISVAAGRFLFGK